jgi:hypothetical protein
LQYLNECQQKLRGWEHRHLWSRINANLTLQVQNGPVASVAFSPDGLHPTIGIQPDMQKCKGKWPIVKKSSSKSWEWLV